MSTILKLESVRRLYIQRESGIDLALNFFVETTISWNNVDSEKIRVPDGI